MTNHITVAFRKRLQDTLFVVSKDENDWQISTSAQSGPAGGTVELRIAYAYEQNWVFAAKLPGTKTEAKYGHEFAITWSCVPGEMRNPEHGAVAGTDSLLRAVHEWAVRIAEELRHAPAMRAAEEARLRVEELEARINLDTKAANERMSALEREEYGKRLDAMQAMLEEAIREQQHGEKEIEAEIAALKLQIASLRDAMSALTKGGWAKKVASFFASVAANPQVQNAAMQLATSELPKLLPPGGG